MVEPETVVARALLADVELVAAVVAVDAVSHLLAVVNVDVGVGVGFAAGLVLCQPDRIADGLLRGLLLAEHDEPGLLLAAVLHLVLEVALDSVVFREV